MDAAPAIASPLPPPALATLMVASCNLLNLALPGRVTYANQAPFEPAEVERKLSWLGAQLGRLNADVVGAQEVWDEPALKEAVARSGLRYAHVVAPGAEQGASGTPRVALVTRLALDGLESIAEFDAADRVPVPDLDPATRFERPVLHAQLRMKHGQPLHVLVAHLKSKRPKFLQDAAGEPLVLLGDMNDGPHSVTSQLIAATTAAAYDRQARDVALYHAWDVQTEPALRRDMAYSHVHLGWPELLDQVWVSEEFVAASRHALGDVCRVEVFNDHLHEGRERWRSDHGFVRALLRVRLPERAEFGAAVDLG